MWRRRAVIMSVFLQGTDCDVNAVMKFPLTFQVCGQVFFLSNSQRAHSSKPFVFCEDMKSNSEENTHHLSTSFSQIVSRMEWSQQKVLFYSLLSCLSQDLWQVGACFYCSYFSGSPTSLLRKSAGHKERHRWRICLGGTQGDFHRFAVSRKNNKKHFIKVNKDA